MPDRQDAIRREVLRRLDQIQDPCSVAGGTPMGLNEMGLVRSVDVSADGDVEIDLRLTSPFCHMIGFMKKTAIEKCSRIEGVHQVDVHGDAGLDWDPGMIAPAAERRRQARIDDASRRLPLQPQRA
jgi:metal-sulfur cluster biosynthetic enzyme